jgi:hypothetical protein
MRARVHRRTPADGMGSPCVVCCSNDDALVNASNLTMDCSKEKALKKIQAWQHHPARLSSSSSSTDEPTVFLDFGDAKKAEWPLCQSCVSLLIRIDRLEAEFVKGVGEFWRALDGSYDFTYEPDPLAVAAKLEFEMILPQEEPGVVSDGWSFELPKATLPKTENVLEEKTVPVADDRQRVECPHCHKSVLNLRQHLRRIHQLPSLKKTTRSSVIPSPSGNSASDPHGESCLWFSAVPRKTGRKFSIWATF